MSVCRACPLLGLLAALAACQPEPAPCAERRPGAVCTVAGSGVAGFSGDRGPAVAAELYLPIDVALGPDQRLYVIDWNNHRIRAVDRAGIIHTVAGSGRLGDGPPGAAVRAAFNHPTEVVFDAEGRMVIAAWHNSRIKRVTLGYGILEDLCGTGRRAYSGDGRPAAVADLDLPASVAFDPAGDLHIMDQANQVIRKVQANGIIDRVAGQCIVGQCAPGQAPLACPGSGKRTCVVVDGVGDCSQPCMGGFAGDGGPALEARLWQPAGQAADPAGRIAFDGEGNLLVADTHNHRIRRIDRSGMITTVAGDGQPGYRGDGGPAIQASLQAPADVTAGNDGSLYVADTGNSCVRVIDPGGVIHTAAGVCGQPGSAAEGDPAARARLDRPYAVALDRDGSLYIADTYNHRVRVVHGPRAATP